MQLHWFPAIGGGEPGDFWDGVRHLVLPAFTVGLSWIGYLARLVRANMLEVLQEGPRRPPTGPMASARCASPCATSLPHRGGAGDLGARGGRRRAAFGRGDHRDRVHAAGAGPPDVRRGDLPELPGRDWGGGGDRRALPGVQPRRPTF
ncbi:MAG: hypothetical protein WDM92_00790 [Caulobacteraceae bacterium]